jgi:uncharacterized protein (TIGR02147 family)
MGEKRLTHNRPDLFRYHDHLAFLKDWLAYLKASQSGFSLRFLGRQAGLASGYLPMVLNGKRQITHKALSKLMPYLGLNPSEQSYLENLLSLSTSDSHEVRVGAVERMQRFPRFQKNNPQDTQVYEYLSHWYYVAIREMALNAGFKADPRWIQEQLRFAVPLNEIETALEFLLDNGYLSEGPKGTVVHPEISLDCSGEVFRVALAGFHREIFSLAAKSIEKTPSDERNIQGHTCALSAEGIAQAKAIVDEAISKIQQLGKSENQSDSVYHLEIALFPVSGGKRKAK